tara:strand:+ start:261 stop:1568 length:1308 start_codon:yes stop_codon:yes gene_type:complete
MYRNAKPLSGAMFIANPRRRRRRKMRRRRNAWHGDHAGHVRAGKLGAQTEFSIQRRAAVKEAARLLRKTRKSKRGTGTVIKRGKLEAINRKASRIRKPRTKGVKAKARKARAKARAAVRKREAAALQLAERSPAFKPYVKGNPMRRRRRSNPKMQPLQKLMNWTKKVQKSVEKVPVAKHFAWAIPAAALGYGTYYLQSAYTPRVVPHLAKLPFVGGWTQRNPYLTGSLILGPLMAFVAHKGYLNKSAVGVVAGATVAIGVALDQAASYSQTSVAGFGDGMRYLIGKDTQALGPLSAYGDASFADAAACPAEMSQHEVSAALSGQYEKCFAPSPHRTRTKGTKYSRHAGHHGHRYGWLVKLIGPAKFHQLCQLPPQQRTEIIQAMKNHALASFSHQLSSQRQAVESAAMPIDGAANGAQGFGSATYGALMYAGGGA